MHRLIRIRDLVYVVKLIADPMIVKHGGFCFFVPQLHTTIVLIFILFGCISVFLSTSFDKNIEKIRLSSIDKNIDKNIEVIIHLQKLGSLPFKKNTAKRNIKPLIYGTADMTSPY